MLDSAHENFKAVVINTESKVCSKDTEKKLISQLFQSLKLCYIFYRIFKTFYYRK